MPSDLFTRFIVAGAVGLTSLLLLTGSVAAQWKPSGPINFMIAFTAGGGADTQARLIASELEKKNGWKILPSNVTGKGGAVLARKLKGQPNDGLSIGIAVTETFGYNMLASKNPGYSISDFTFITTTAGSQMGIYAAASKGWKNWSEVVKAGRGGKTLRFGVMSQKLSDIAFLLGQRSGIKFNTVILRGGRAVLNAVNAGDLDLGFGAGIQNKAVRAGALNQIVSAELHPLQVSPDAPTITELGLPYDGGSKFMIFGPKGIPSAARRGIAAAISGVLNSEGTQAARFVKRAFGGPQLISGKELEDLIKQTISDSRKLMAASG